MYIVGVSVKGQMFSKTIENSHSKNQKCNISMSK